MVSLLDQARYRNRKHFISQNTLGACSMDMKFSYVLTGWEGSASNSKVLQSALRRWDPLVVLIGHDHANGDGAKITGETATQMESDEINNDTDQATTDVELENKRDGIELNLPNGIGSQQRGGHETQKIKRPIRKRSRSGDALASAINSMAETIKLMANAYIQRAPVTLDVDKLYPAVNRIPDLDENMHLDIIDFLTIDTKKA
ncbi:hypothetical protein HHK36_026256 [Tetracentron sinense]|uniref:Uncharacterized protein n=1 Tax=Tetracentron sinense TaxID=13715 RepID=A0A835D225_TETSI|nr:hypothetical protein HHK36_026256 [Tetracentron sinense]